jgi:hypothetical protein
MSERAMMPAFLLLAVWSAFVPHGHVAGMVAMSLLMAAAHRKPWVK